MKSDMPKVLTPVAGKPIILHLIDALKSLTTNPIVVVGHGADEVKSVLSERAQFVFQTEQKGTGHAVAEVLRTCSSLKEHLIVMPGDHPMVRAETFHSIANIHMESGAVVTMATLEVPHYEGHFSVFYNYGRVLRNDKGEVVGIRERKDASPEELLVREVSPSYYCFNTEWLRANIAALNENNASHEFYLTDMLGIARRKSQKISTILLSDYREAMGINTPEQKMLIEGAFFASLSSPRSNEHHNTT